MFTMLSNHIVSPLLPPLVADTAKSTEATVSIRAAKNNTAILISRLLP